MTATQALPVVALPPPPFDATVAVKMEDRKRSLANDAAEDVMPSRKRARDENGQQMRMDAEKERDVENYQKDAILRQMKEYKRQKRDLEDQNADLLKRCEFHNDHLRTIDAWFAQLLDEIRVKASETLPPKATDAGVEIYTSALLFENNAKFSEHLQARSISIRTAISDLFGRMPSASPDVEDLRRQLNELLAKEKQHAVELRKAIDDKESISERLEAASYRYMTAEKKLDRAKSSQVLKLEKAAMMGSSAEASSPTTSKKAATPKREQSEVNGEAENAAASAETEAARREAVAVADQRKAQLDEIEQDNERLTNELSAARTKLVSLTDDDYAETSLFKTVKSQYEEVVNRVNDLEASSTQLRQENQRLQTERTSYRSVIDDEHRNTTIETETQLARTENDLSRIRVQRDDLVAELSVRKTAEDTRRISTEQTKELVAARDARISALESEVERLRLQNGESPTPDTNLDDLDPDTLKNKLRTLQAQHELLGNELASMASAWRKAQGLASQKVQEISDFEEQISRLNMEKTKANQKYFDAMKTKDLQQNELKAVKNQNLRSSEIVTQLKDTEGRTRELVANLERQVVEAKEELAGLERQYKGLEQKHKDLALTGAGVSKQIEDYKALIAGKDREILDAKKAKREMEEEAEKTKVRLEDATKQLDTLRQSMSSAAGGTGSEANWRKVAICPVCNTNIRNTVIKLCGHVFCRNCVNDLISNRSRKCPSCGRAFGNGDHMPIVLT